MTRAQPARDRFCSSIRPLRTPTLVKMTISIRVYEVEVPPDQFHVVTRYDELYLTA